MVRLLVVLGVVLVLRSSAGEASCAWIEPVKATIVVDTCTPVDTAKLKAPATPESYAGILLEGTVTAGKAKPAREKLWVPASEKLTCAAARPKARLAGKLSYACCDGDPNPPCYLDTSSIFGGIKAVK